MSCHPFGLRCKLHLANGPPSHHIEESEKQVTREESLRREDNLERFGIDHPEPTSEIQKTQETDQLIAQMTTRWPQIHQEHITEGSGAYSPYQEEAFPRSPCRPTPFKFIVTVAIIFLVWPSKAGSKCARVKIAKSARLERMQSPSPVTSFWFFQ